MDSSFHCEQYCFDRVFSGDGYEQHLYVCVKLYLYMHTHTELTLQLVCFIVILEKKPHYVLCDISNIFH